MVVRPGTHRDTTGRCVCRSVPRVACAARHVRGISEEPDRAGEPTRRVRDGRGRGLGDVAIARMLQGG